MSNTKTIRPVDLTYLTWSLSRSSIGTAGSFLTSYEEINGRKFYYKMSNYDSVRWVIGHESVTEIVTEQILRYCKRGILTAWLHCLITGYRLCSPVIRMEIK